ncbi:Protein of unknown function DUF677 [Dillenia turbinata]|uniref:Uncharacterized protein n=1 Tax=Dillenia turbinata TaxID=194707 RepID=A0AAN8UW87_9MAGN
MLACLSSKSSASQGNPSVDEDDDDDGNDSVDSNADDPSTSRAANLTREYTLHVQTNSYNEIRSQIRIYTSADDEDSEEVLLAQVLQPNHDRVQEALKNARPSTLTSLVSAYFDHSENTSRLCLLLSRSVNRAREHYKRIEELLEVFPMDLEGSVLTQSQCNWAFDVFVQFDALDNPFPSPDSHNFGDMRGCFLLLKQQLDLRLKKSQSRIRIIRRATEGSALCLIGTVVGVAVTAVVIVTHALGALVAGGGSLLTNNSVLTKRFTQKELAHLAQLDAAAKGTYVLDNDLATIDRLVVRLHSHVEDDKALIQIGLASGKDRYNIQGVVKHLHKNHQSFLCQLTDLEEHIYLCFSMLNRARSLLLEEICLHQDSVS